MKNKFSNQIEADQDGYHMSCPEIVGKHIAKQLSQFKTAVELCCSVGMLSIQLAKVMNKVIAIDNNKERIEMAKNNAKLYGTDNIEFILSDVLDVDLLKRISAEVVVLDPDWSAEGEEKHIHTNDIDSTQPSLRKMFNLTKEKITSDIVMRIPKTFTFDTLKDFGKCRIENIIWNGETKFKVAYFLPEIKENEEINVVFD